MSRDKIARNECNGDIRRYMDREEANGNEEGEVMQQWVAKEYLAACTNKSAHIQLSTKAYLNYDATLARSFPFMLISSRLIVLSISRTNPVNRCFLLQIPLPC